MGAQGSFKQVWMMSKLANSLQGRGYQFRYGFLEGFWEPNGTEKERQS